MSFPSKAEREKCWASRDDFWKCLDENESSHEVCSKFRQLYETTCPSQWVKHFDRKREYLKFKDRIQKEGCRNGSCNSSAASMTSTDFVGEEQTRSQVGRDAAGGSRTTFDGAAAAAQDLNALTTTMLSCRRRRRTDDEDKEVLCGVSASGVSVRTPKSGADNDTDDTFNVLLGHHASDKDSQQLAVISSSGDSSSTKIPSPRIFRRWQAFQPPTYT